MLNTQRQQKEAAAAAAAAHLPPATHTSSAQAAKVHLIDEAAVVRALLVSQFGEGTAEYERYSGILLENGFETMGDLRLASVSKYARIVKCR